MNLWGNIQYYWIKLKIVKMHKMYNTRVAVDWRSWKKTRTGVYKILCPQHLLVPKYDQISSVVIPQNILDFAQTFNK